MTRLSLEAALRVLPPERLALVDPKRPLCDQPLTHHEQDDVLTESFRIIEHERCGWDLAGDLAK